MSVALYVEERGRGPVLLLGHSFLCSGAMWAPQVAQFEGSYRVVNADLRGHGASPAATGRVTLDDQVADMIAVLDEREIESAVWMGLSVGGMIAIRAALAHPDRVRALVLANTDACAENMKTKLRFSAMAIGSRLFGVGPFLGSVNKMMFGATSLKSRRELVATWRARFAVVDLDSILAFLPAVQQRESLLERLHEIEVPTLVVVGVEDKALPPIRSERLAAGIPGARLVRLEGAGHLSCLEQPEAFNQAVEEFLATVVASS